MLCFTELTEIVFIRLFSFPLQKYTSHFPAPCVCPPVPPSAPTHSKSQQELQEGEQGSFVTCTDEGIKDLCKYRPLLAARVGAAALCAWIRSPMNSQPQPTKLHVWPWKVKALIHSTTQSIVLLILLLMKDNIIMLAKSMVMAYDSLPPCGCFCIRWTLSTDCWTAGRKRGGKERISTWHVRQ